MIDVIFALASSGAYGQTIFFTGSLRRHGVESAIATTTGMPLTNTTRAKIISTRARTVTILAVRYIHDLTNFSNLPFDWRRHASISRAAGRQVRCIRGDTHTLRNGTILCTSNVHACSVRAGCRSPIIIPSALLVAPRPVVLDFATDNALVEFFDCAEPGSAHSTSFLGLHERDGLFSTKRTSIRELDRAVVSPASIRVLATLLKTTARSSVARNAPLFNRGRLPLQVFTCSVSDATSCPASLKYWWLPSALSTQLFPTLQTVIIRYDLIVFVQATHRTSTNHPAYWTFQS